MGLWRQLAGRELMKKKPHPTQPLLKDKDGTMRFKPNTIVQFLLDHGGFDMNKLAVIEQFSDEDRCQFAQLIGYSLSGYGELSYVSDAALLRAGREGRGLKPKHTYG
jgi:hypothetical protein